MRLIALIVFTVTAVALMSIAPASAQDTGLRPKGAVPLLNGCQGMMGYPDCHPERTSAVPNPATPLDTGTHRQNRRVTEAYPKY